MLAKIKKPKARIIKPKPEKIHLWSGSKIQKYINYKYKNNGAKFWDWFFSETSFGDHNVICFLEDEFYSNNPILVEYAKLLEKEFGKNIDDEYDLKIERDF